MEHAYSAKDKCVLNFIKVYKGINSSIGLYYQPAVKFQALADLLQKYAKGISDFIYLFSKENVKIHGSIYSATNQNDYFHTFFNGGGSNDKGVIANFSLSLIHI